MSHYSDKQYISSGDSDTFYYNAFFKKGDRILDVGCSTGNFIAQDPDNIIGIDMDYDAIRIARKRGFKAIKHDIKKKLPFKDNSIENVNCRHVLEHLENPLFFMKEIFRVLKKNGRLVLVTDELTNRFWDDYTHKRPFTRLSLKQIAYDTGFRDYKVSYFPVKGVFGAGFLHRNKILPSNSARKLYLFFARALKSGGLVLEATK